jgi:FkbM family methyltransferase
VSSLKPALQTFLTRIGLYQRLKGSPLYDLYWRIADSRIVEGRSSEIAFYKTVLKGFRKGDLIFDVGANHGSKTDIFLRLGARVVAVEPDETNQTALRQRFLTYRLVAKPVTIVGKAVSDETAIATMWIDAPGSAKNTLSRKWVDTLTADEHRFGYSLDFLKRKEVETTTLEQLIVAHGFPFFVKIDVEGFERMVLQGLKRPIPYISFEVNLPEFKREGLECVELLERVTHDGLFNYAASAQQGLILKRWLGAQDFSQVLSDCTEKSVDVFWTTTASTPRRSSR